jgi:uncharacterized protein (DUF2141 family)
MFFKKLLVLLLFTASSHIVYGQLIVTGTVTNASCSEAPDGAIDITAVNGIPPYTYNWSIGTTFLGVTTEDISGLKGGFVYTVVVTDAQGDKNTTSYQVNIEAFLVVADIMNASCAEGGSISLSPLNGKPPYSYQWDHGPTSATITDLVPGTYRVTYWDANGCSDVTKFLVDGPANPLSLSLNTFNIVCFGDEGAIDLSVNGGKQPYLYSWSNGATTEDLSGLSANTYTVTVTDAEQCSQSATATIAASVPLSITANIQNECYGGNNGAIYLSVTGGAVPYTFQWSNNATTRDISGLSADTYTVIVTDANQCAVVESFTLMVAQPIDVSLAVTPNTSCKHYYNGAIQATVTGGEPPYRFQWANGENPLSDTSKDLSGLAAGSYSLLVTDIQGCVFAATATVHNQFPAYSLNLDKGDVSCAGASDGWISVEMHSGYKYTWYTGSDADPAKARLVTAPTISGLAGGIYTVQALANDTGCKYIASIYVDEAAPIAASFSVIAATSCIEGMANGIIQTQLTGGTTPYTYRWLDGATTANRDGLAAGTYQLTVVDADGCSIGPLVVEVPFAPLHPSISLSSMPNESCDGNYTGAISASININGSYQYRLSYQYNPSEAILQGANQTSLNLTFTNLESGTYLLEIIQENGCAAVETIYVAESPPIIRIDTVSVIAQSNCNAEGDGKATVTAILENDKLAFLNDYTFSWIDVSGTLVGQGSTISSLTAGTYIVEATKHTNPGSGCTSVPFEVVVPHNPVYAAIALNSISDQTCLGTPNGSISAVISSPTTVYSWRWTKTDDPSFSRTGTEVTTASLSDLAAGEYLLNVITAMGCEMLASAVVAHEPLYPTIDFTKGDVSCHGEANGWVSLEAQANMEYSLWRNETLVQAAFTGRLEGLQPGEYQLKSVNTLTSCEAITSLTIAEPALLHLTATVQQLSASEAADGNITLSVSGGVPPYTYLWSNGATSSDLDGLMHGTYSVAVTDANNCSQEISFVIDPVAPLGLADGESAGILRVSRTSSGHLRVQLTEGINARELSLYRLDGSLSAQTDMLGKNVAEIRLPIAEPRFYLLVLTTKEKVYRKKIVF